MVKLEAADLIEVDALCKRWGARGTRAQTSMR
jgi:hypothetical protein